MKPVRFEDEAHAELKDAAQWYEQRQAGLGKRYLRAVSTSLEQIARMPLAGSLAPGVPAQLTVRRVPVRRFPYTIAYLETGKVIRVLAIAHDRRRPGYWLSRV